MSVEINVTGEVVTAYLKGELDHHTAKEMREAIDGAVELNMPSLLILDFEGITFMDSSGIGLILGRYRMLKTVGGKIKVKNSGVNIERILMVSGLYKIVERI